MSVVYFQGGAVKVYWKLMNNIFKWKITQFTFSDNNLKQISTVQCYNHGTMTEVKTVWYACVVTVTVTIVWKWGHFNVICRMQMSDVGNDMH